MTRLGPAGPVETWYLGPAELVFHPGETAHYRDNLASGTPRLWVALAAGGAVVGLTANPYEGEGLAGDPGLVVDGLAMPASIAAALEAFFAAHHVERAFEKRSRRRADPEALARGRR